MWVQSLGREDPLEEGMATLSSILSCSIPMNIGAWWAMAHRVAKKWTQLKELAAWRGLHVLLQGIFPTQGLNPHFLCLLHWQAGSLPLVPPGKPLRVSRGK